MEGRTPTQEAIHRELYNRSRDIVRIYNPDKEDFRFKYDSVWYKVEAGKTKDVEAYLAQKFFHDYAQMVIGKMIIAKGEELLKDRERKSLDPILDKYYENKQIWDLTPKMDNKELLDQIFNQVVLGIVEVFGSEVGPEEFAPVKQNGTMNTTIDESVFAEGLKAPLREVPETVSKTEKKPILKTVMDKPSAVSVGEITQE